MYQYKDGKGEKKGSSSTDVQVILALRPLRRAGLGVGLHFHTTNIYL